MQACILTKLFLACCPGSAGEVTWKTSPHHRFYIALEWNDRGCQTLHHNFDLDEWICLKLQQDIPKISFYVTNRSHFWCYLSCFENILGKGEDCIFWDALYRQIDMHACIHTNIHTYTHTYIHAHTYIYTYVRIYVRTHVCVCVCCDADFAKSYRDCYVYLNELDVGKWIIYTTGNHNQSMCITGEQSTS